MAIPSINALGDNASLQEVIDAYERFRKEYQFKMTGRVDSKNAREFGGYQVGDDYLRSINGLVGLSSAGTTADSVRIWAGDAVMTNAPFQVWQDGSMSSTKGRIGGFVIAAKTLTDALGSTGFNSDDTVSDDIRIFAGKTAGLDTAKFRVTEGGLVYCAALTAEGGVIRTGAVGTARLELIGAGLRGVTSDGLLSGLVFSPTVTDIVDLSIYHRGAQLLEFYDEITNYAIRPGSGSSFMALGASGKTTYGRGTWEFINPVNADITGNAATAILAQNVVNLPTLSGDVSNTGNSVYLQSTGVLSGTYSSLSVGSDGRITAGTNPTYSADKALISNALGAITTSPVTTTELGYVSGVTSAIQSQINTKITASGVKRVRAYSNANQALAAGTPTKINYSAETYDTKAEFDPSTSTFTASEAGLYRFTASAYFQAFGAAQQYGLYIYKNGTRHEILTFDTTGSNNDIIGRASCEVDLALNDTVTIYAYCSAGTNLINGSDSTVLTISKMN